jgi:hypothetical protein
LVSMHQEITSYIKKKITLWNTYFLFSPPLYTTYRNFKLFPPLLLTLRQHIHWQRVKLWISILYPLKCSFQQVPRRWDDDRFYGGGYQQSYAFPTLHGVAE